LKNYHYTFIHEQIQRFLNPVTLFLAQQSLNFLRHPRLITPQQRTQLKPFFIIGSGRSGTTLLRRILQSHPLIDIPPESHGAIPIAVKKFYRYRGADWQDIVSIVLGQFLSIERFSFWHVDLSSAFVELTRIEPEKRSLAIIIDTIFQYHLKQHKPQARIWGDKTPVNTIRLKWIHRLFPEAKYIHMLRDGRDVANSFYKARLFPDLETAALRWNLSVKTVEKFKQKIPSHKMLTVRYENLVQNPQENVEKVCRFLSIEFIPEMLNEEPINGLGDSHVTHHQKVLTPISTDSIGRWKTELSPEQQKIITRIMKKWLIKLGYMT